jgi:hypothetical protein
MQHKITKKTKIFNERGSSLFCEDFIACFQLRGKENFILIAASIANGSEFKLQLVLF